jgi:16S rRNA (guanine527-N7)-methyltransferase
LTIVARGDASVFDVPPPALRAAAVTYFGDQVDLAGRYAASLATDAVVRGLIGPREADRIWERHLLNCAAVARLLPPRASVVDVGSGAGLPGIVLAIARPDVYVTLVEPLSRRTSYLVEVVDALSLTSRVTVVRARAEDAAGSMFHVKPADVVTARALAPLDRLAAWCLPLAKLGGRVMAIKGASARVEASDHAAALIRLGAGEPSVREIGVGILPEPTTIVEFERTHAVGVDAPRSGGTRADQAAPSKPKRRSPGDGRRATSHGDQIGGGRRRRPGGGR